MAENWGSIPGQILKVIFFLAVFVLSTLPPKPLEEVWACPSLDPHSVDVQFTRRLVVLGSLEYAEAAL